MDLCVELVQERSQDGILPDMRLHIAYNCKYVAHSYIIIIIIIIIIITTTTTTTTMELVTSFCALLPPGWFAFYKG